RVVSRFTQDRKTLTSVEGWGKIVNILLSAMPGDTSGRKEIVCDHFWSEPGPNGQIAAFDASGAPAHAMLSGPPARDITALTFRAGLANKMMSDLKAEGGVVMKEPSSKREMRSDHLMVFFDQKTHHASNATAEGNFKYNDPRNTANAVRANFDIPSDNVVLSAEPGFDPTVVTDGNTLKAKLIEFSPKAQTAK